MSQLLSPTDLQLRLQSLVTKPSKRTKEQHFEAYNKLRQRMKNQLKEAAKGQGTSLALNNIDELTRLYSIVEKDHVRDTKVHLEDSEVFKEASGFAALNARNIRLGETGVSLNEKDVIKRLKRWAATDESVVGVVKQDASGNGNEVEGEESDDDASDADDSSMDNDLLADEFTFNKINWLKLGVLYHQLSKKAISVNFLHGPLASERKRAAPRARTVDDTKNGTSTTARAVEARDIQDDEEKNTAYMVRMIYEIYLTKDDGEELNFYKFFIDPFSFAQSVENLFYTSFLVKDGRLKLYRGKNGYPCVMRVSQQEIEESRLDGSNLFSSHHIATFNYDVWHYLIETFDIKDSFLGHRDEDEDQIPEEDLNEEDDEEASENGNENGREIEEEEDKEEEEAAVAEMLNGKASNSIDSLPDSMGSSPSTTASFEED